MVGDKIVSVDRKEFAGHTCSCPVKRRRATLGSEPLRDSRMRLRRIFRPGKSIDLPGSFYFEYPELPLMP